MYAIRSYYEASSGRVRTIRPIVLTSRITSYNVCYTKLLRIGNQFIAMLKDTSLISVTGAIWEILWRAQKVGRANFRTLEALLIAAVFYWIITIIFSAAQSRLETYMARGERSL